MPRTSKTILNNLAESRHTCLVPDLRANAFSFSPLRIMFAVGLSYMALLCWGRFLLCPFLKSFNHKWVLNFVKVFFLHLLRLSYFFCLFSIFIWLCQVLVVALRLSICGTQGSVIVALGLSYCVAGGIIVPQPGIEPASPALWGRLLTTGAPGNSLSYGFYLSVC